MPAPTPVTPRQPATLKGAAPKPVTAVLKNPRPDASDPETGGPPTDPGLLHCDADCDSRPGSEPESS